MASGGLIAGDLNPIHRDFDEFSKSLGVKDAAEQNGEFGHTWGDQKTASGGEWPNARLDRILYWSPEHGGGGTQL